MPRSLDPGEGRSPAGAAHAWWAVVMVLAVLLVYVPALRNGFVLDDDIAITENHHVTAPGGLYRIWFTTQVTDYWPLTNSLYRVEWNIFGAEPLGYHVVSLALHAANVLLVWRVLVLLGVPGAALAGLLFAVHPVGVESVAWVVQQKTLLAMFLCLVSLHLYLQCEMHGGRIRYALSLAAFLAALLAKTSVVMLPVVLLAGTWWLGRGGVRRAVLRAAPFLVLSLVLGLVTWWVQHARVIGEEVVCTYGPVARLLVAMRGLWFYLQKDLVPLNLSPVYPRWHVQVHEPLAWWPLVALAACLAVFFRCRGSWARPVWFALVCFTAGLFPVLGFVDDYWFKYSFVTDHWQYHALPAFLALVVAGARRLVECSGSRWAASAVGALAVLALGLLSMRHMHAFESKETFFRTALRHDPEIGMAHMELAAYFRRQGLAGEAGRHSEEGKRIYGDLIQQGRAEPFIYGDLAWAHIVEGRPVEAESLLREVIRRRPGYAKAIYHLGVALDSQGRMEDAVEQYRLAIGCAPDYAAPRNSLARILAVQGERNQALAQFAEVLRIHPYNPHNADVHVQMAGLLVRDGRLQEAADHYRQALDLDPGLKRARQNLDELLRLKDRR